jgi:hypothetical protein
VPLSFRIVSRNKEEEKKKKTWWSKHGSSGRIRLCIQSAALKKKNLNHRKKVLELILFDKYFIQNIFNSLITQK